MTVPALMNDNGESDEVMFPDFVKRRAALQQIIQLQMEKSERLFPTDKLLCQLKAAADSKNRPSVTGSLDKAPKGNGDASSVIKDQELEDSHHNDTADADAPDEDDLDFNLTMTFDTVEEIKAFKKRYINSIANLMKDKDSANYQNSNQGQESTSRCYIPNFSKVGNQTKKAFRQIPRVASSAIVGYKKRTKVLGAIAQFAIAAIVFAVVMKLCCEPLYRRFADPVHKFAERFEFPWSVFMREPFMQGLIYPFHSNQWREQEWKKLFDWEKLKNLLPNLLNFI